MKTQKTTDSIKKKRLNILTAILFVIICIAIGILCFQYYNNLKSTLKDESKGYMMEISKQMGNNINRNINDNFSSLETISTSIKNSNISTFTELTTIINIFQQQWNFTAIMLIGNDYAHNSSGQQVHLENSEYLQTAVVGRKPALSSSETIDGIESIVFAIPTNITIDNKHFSAFAASYNLTTFDQILSMNAFDGKGYAHIIDKDGTMIIRSSSKHAPDTGVNFLNSLNDSNILSGDNIEKISANISGGISGFAEIRIGGSEQYMVYSALEEQITIHGEQKFDHDWRLLTFVPTSVVNAKSNMFLNITLIIISFIALAFALLFTWLFVVSYRSKRKLEKIAYVDSVTNGNTIQFFYELSENILRKYANTQYALVYTNIDKFKLLNEQFGKSNCDKILKGIYYAISKDLEIDECMGRQYADNFVVLLKYYDEKVLLERIKSWKLTFTEYLESNNVVSAQFNIKFGAYIINNKSMPIPNMIDRAKLSLTEANCTMYGNIKFAIYDEEVRKTMVREKHLEDMMESALAKNEFKVYLQPKYCTQTEEVGGAEALVRWASPTDGLIYPNDFIPLFEKNGFIIKLDLFIFEEVCKMMKTWMENGQRLIHISVNCSRINLKNPKFISQYEDIANKYSVPKEYFEIEFTENIVFEDIENFTSVINSVHSAGFSCSMDDFGSGFSSLSMIQDIPVDTLKLDKIFFQKRSGQASKRTQSVIASIITMAKALSLTTVAEGIEDKKQVEMLKELGCDLIQGFYYAKPMPIEQFTEFIQLKNNHKTSQE